MLGCLGLRLAGLGFRALYYGPEGFACLSGFGGRTGEGGRVGGWVGNNVHSYGDLAQNMGICSVFAKV